MSRLVLLSFAQVARIHVLLSFAQVAGIHLTFNMDTRFHEYDKQKNVALSAVVIMTTIFKHRV
ncbi:hypothetical protein AGMMS50233_10960 [Endomicrobiia bacterium]|nr:hypothetical protein AGMMS50233_10960 [Endomicrobiia bacterium]